MKRRTRLNLMTLLTPLRHPLVLTVLLYVPLCTLGSLSDSRFFLLEPLALAGQSSDEALASEDIGARLAEANQQERLQLELGLAQDRVAWLEAEVAGLRQVAPQLVQLQLLNPHYQKQAIPAGILLRADSSGWRHGLYLDRGSNEGISVGDAVTFGSFLVGRVTAVQANLSVVQLLSDVQSDVPVYIMKGQGYLKPSQPDVLKIKHDDAANPDLIEGVVARGVVRGDGSGTLRMPNLKLDHVAVDTPVEVGMLVVTNGTSGKVPAGLIVGRITSIEDRSVQLDVRISCEWDADLMTRVLVIPNQRPSLNDVTRMLVQQQHLDIVRG